jgi:hypothetical protein
MVLKYGPNIKVIKAILIVILKGNNSKATIQKLQLKSNYPKATIKGQQLKGNN